MPDNQFQAALRAALRAHPTRPKLLLVPDLQSGQAAIQHLAVTGTPTANLRAITPAMLALEPAEPRLVADGREPASRIALALLVEDLLAGAAPGTPLGDYLGTAPCTPGLTAALQGSLRDLRLAGLTATSLDPNAFETPAKGAAVQELPASYEQGLQDRKLADEADIYRLAIAEVPFGPDSLYLLPANLEQPTGLAGEFLAAVTADCTLQLPCDERAECEIALYHASGPYNEVRAAIRRVFAAGHPFDDTELVVTDMAAYAPVIRDLLIAQEIPATFARGLPVRETAAGRALAATLAWVGENFRAITLARAVAEEALAVPDDLPGLSSAFGRFLREAPIGWGRERYLPQLAQQEATLQAKLAARESAADEEESPAEARSQGLQRALERIRALKAWVGELLALFPTPDEEGLVSLADLAAACAKVLESWTPHRLPGGPDAAAKAHLIELLAEVGLYGTGRYTMADAVRRLELLLDGETAGASGPKPGHLHVTDLAGAGWSGRSHVYLLGMDAERFPGAGLQDPVLLDSERTRLSEALPLSAASLDRQQRRLWQFVAGLRGNFICSYSSSDPVGDRSGFPSPELLALERLRSGQTDTDYSELLKGLGTAEGYVPSAPDSALDEQDWWLAKLVQPDGRIRDGREAVLIAHPQLAAGLLAQAEREKAELTCYDGWVGSDSDLDPRDS